jgi:hypothetical protein
MTDDPPRFAADCFVLLGFIYLGENAFLVDVPALDTWVMAHAPEESAAKYWRKRATAVAAYRAYLQARSAPNARWTHGLDPLRSALEDMHVIVYALMASPLAHAKAKANRAAKEAALKPRVKGRNRLRAAIMKLMKRYRIDDTSFKVFIKAWEAESLDGLRLVATESGYRVDDENSEHCAFKATRKARCDTCTHAPCSASSARAKRGNTFEPLHERN